MLSTGFQPTSSTFPFMHFAWRKCVGLNWILVRRQILNLLNWRAHPRVTIFLRCCWIYFFLPYDVSISNYSQTLKIFWWGLLHANIGIFPQTALNYFHLFFVCLPLKKISSFHSAQQKLIFFAKSSFFISLPRRRRRAFFSLRVNKKGIFWPRNLCEIIVNEMT